MAIAPHTLHTPRLEERLKQQNLHLKTTPAGAAALSICRAVDQNQFKFGLEPVHSLRTIPFQKEILPMEYLLRPVDESGAPINLASGLNFLRETGLSSQFDMVVIPKAIAQARKYGDAGLPISINIAPESLQDPYFLEDLKTYLISLSQAMHNPEAIVFEIPLTGNTKAETLGWMKDIQTLGFRIAIDNFGHFTPFEFEAICHLKPAFVKIDGQLIHSALTNGAAAPTLRHLIEGVRRASPTTRLIAPWVTNIQQAKRLYQVYKIDAVQGRDLPKDRAYFSSEWALYAKPTTQTELH